MSELQSDSRFPEDLAGVFDRLSALRGEVRSPDELDLTIVRSLELPGEPEQDYLPIIAAETRGGDRSKRPDDPAEETAQPEPSENPKARPLDGLALGDLIVGSILGADARPAPGETETENAESAQGSEELLSPQELTALAEKLGAVASVRGVEQLRHDIDDADLAEEAKQILRTALDSRLPPEIAADVTDAEAEQPQTNEQ